MNKITDKVGSAICRDTNFLTRLNNVVWNDDMEPAEFEEKWLKVISDFSLEDNTWLSAKFANRHMWIPAYFRNVPMGSLLRTTQRSESANSFFKRFENKYGTLTEFLMRYESAIDQQKHMLKLLEEENENSIPETLYGSKWETQAVRSYTHEIFVNIFLICGFFVQGIHGFNFPSILKHVSNVCKHLSNSSFVFSCRESYRTKR